MKTACWVADSKNLASQNPNTWKYFPSLLPFLLTNPLGMAVMNWQLPPIARIVAQSKKPSSIPGHSWFAVAITGKAVFFKRVRTSNPYTCTTLRWYDSLLSLPKPDIVLTFVCEIDTSFSIWIEFQLLPMPSFALLKHFAFQNLLSSLSEVKVNGQVNPWLLKTEFTVGWIKSYPTNTINLNLDSTMLTQGLGSVSQSSVV